MRIVIDTNVVASAIFFGGKPRHLIERVMDGYVHVFATKEIIDEYRDTVDYLHHKYANNSMNPALNLIIRKIKLIEGKASVDVCRDPDDNKFIECAIDAKCFYIVSGDKDLLSIGIYDDIQILTVSEFLGLLETTE